MLSLESRQALAVDLLPQTVGLAGVDFLLPLVVGPDELRERYGRIRCIDCDLNLAAQDLVAQAHPPSPPLVRAAGGGRRRHG